LRDATYDLSVFLKDTTDHRHEEVFADRRFLAEARRAFLIRRPEKIAASFYALAPDMGIQHDRAGDHVRVAGRGRRRRGNPSARWYAGVSASSGLGPQERVYPHTVENSAQLARFAAHHLPFYEELYAQRMDVTPWEQAAGS
jgi:hypothetical protein